MFVVLKKTVNIIDNKIRIFIEGKDAWSPHGKEVAQH